MDVKPTNKSVENTILVLCAIAIVVAGIALWRNATTRSLALESMAVSEESREGFKSDRQKEIPRSGITILVNKDNPLPAGYLPESLVAIGLPGADDATGSAVIVEPLRQLFNDAEQAGYKLSVLSAYRSYYAQQEVYQSFVDGYSEDYAEQVSAKPGYSEHQTGLAVDVGEESGLCELDACFGDTAAGKWVESNAHLYGFVIRYQQNKQSSTGYVYEPWHLRYLGNPLATELFSTNQTYEEYLGITEVE
jgi:zinc D-Ala-D-Ala carboxypeptidase